MAIDTHGVKGKPWVGFDLDGTLATYDKWRGIQHIGEPVKPMCDLIKKLRDEGKAVKILTARVAPKDGDTKEAAIARAFIAKWCKDNLGFVPPITHEKDSLMETLYDDRVKAVEQNTGKVLNMAKFKVGDKVKVYHGTKEGKVLSVEEGMRGPIYKVQLGTLHGVPYVHLFEEKELVAANAARSTNSIVAKAMNAVVKNAVVLKALNAGNYSEKQIIDAAMQTLESRLRSIPMPGYSGPTRNYLKLIYKPNTTPQGSFSGEISAEANITEETTFDEAKAGKFGVVVYTSLGRLAPRTKIFGSINEAVAFIKGQVMPKAAKFLSEGQSKRQSDMAAKRKEDSSRRAYEKYGAVSYSNSIVTEKAVNAKDAEGTVIKVGDTVILADEGDYDNPKEFKVKSISGSYIHLDDGHHEYEKDLLVYNSRACNSTNPIVRKAMNATALNFSPGDKVSIVDTDIRYGGDKGEVVRKDGFRYVVRLTSRQDKPEVTLQPNQLKAMNAVARNDWEQTYEIKGLPVVLTYRGSPFNDIKATVKGGNRDWIEVARVIASSPVSQAEAEKMVAPKWSRIKRTAPNAVARNAEDDWVERFEVGGVYNDGPYNGRKWLAKVLSRTDSSIRVAIKSRRDKSWGPASEQVTLRINKKQAETDGTEVAKGLGWEFWANDFE